MDNLFELHEELVQHSYVHGTYQAFTINDPKPRDIHKAMVRDRLLHHAVYRVMYPFFDQIFIHDSYSCRLGKGTHKAVNRFRQFGNQVSKNHTKTTWVLKCDIRKFFASIDQEVLVGILKKYIPDPDIIWLLKQVIQSFHSTQSNIGLPLGNLTSQLFVNIYMNEFDQFMKHRMRVKYYIRYADDFVVLSPDKDCLLELLPKVGSVLSEELHLDLHPHKVSVQTLASGVDFLGWVHFPDHRVLRTATRRRMFKKLYSNQDQAVFDSYAGLLNHGNSHALLSQIAFLKDFRRPEEGRERAASLVGDDGVPEEKRAGVGR